jgi:hypothetical protein
MSRKHSASGLLAIFQAGSSLAENWLMYGIWYKQIWFKCQAFKTLHGIMPGLAPKMKQQLVSGVAVLFYFILIHYLVNINNYNVFFGKKKTT